MKFYNTFHFIFFQFLVLFQSIISNYYWWCYLFCALNTFAIHNSIIFRHNSHTIFSLVLQINMVIIYLYKALGNIGLLMTLIVPFYEQRTCFHFLMQSFKSLRDTWSYKMLSLNLLICSYEFILFLVWFIMLIDTYLIIL